MQQMRTMQADEQQRMLFPPILHQNREYATSSEFKYNSSDPIGKTDIMENNVGKTISYQANSWERKLLNLNMTHFSKDNFIKKRNHSHLRQFSFDQPN